MYLLYELYFYYYHFSFLGHDLIFQILPLTDIDDDKNNYAYKNTLQQLLQTCIQTFVETSFCLTGYLYSYLYSYIYIYKLLLCLLHYNK